MEFRRVLCRYGIQFWKHLSRTQILLQIVDLEPFDGSDPVDEANTIINELDNYSHELAQKPRWLVLNKADLLDDDALKVKQDEIVQQLNWRGPVHVISALSKTGTEALAFDIMKQLEANWEAEQEQRQDDEDNPYSKIEHEQES